MTSSSLGNSEESYEDLQGRVEEGTKVLEKLNGKLKEAETNQPELVPDIKDKISELEGDLEETKEKILSKKCVKRDVDLGWMKKNIEPCKTYLNSESYAYWKKAIESEHVIDPCGKSTLGKINSGLQQFFKDLKDAKKAYNEFVVPALNALSGIRETVANATALIAGAIKILIQRARDWLLKAIKDKLEDVFEETLPDLAKNIKSIAIKQIIDTLFCKFADIIKGLSKLVGEFLFALIGNLINAPFCAAEQFANALLNNIANRIDKALEPILSGLDSVLGGVGKIAGSIFNVIDTILGFEAFLCNSSGINCPELKSRQASWWGGPQQKAADRFQNFLNGLNLSSGETSDLLNRFNRWLGGDENGIGDWDIFGTKFGDIDPSLANQFQCYGGKPNCGPPKVQIFGGGGIGAVGDAVVNRIGQVVGVNLTNKGYGYTSPPYVAFIDDCNSGNHASGYAVLTDDYVNTPIDPITFSPIGESGGDTIGSGSGASSEQDKDGKLKCIYRGDVYHEFDNDNDITRILEVSSGFDIIPGGETMPDRTLIGQDSLSSDKKHYKVRFNVPYDNADYDIEITRVAQQSAAGGTGGIFQPVKKLSGELAIRNKTKNGFDIWFGRTAARRARPRQAPEAQSVPIIRLGTLFTREGNDYYLYTGGNSDPFDVVLEFAWNDSPSAGQSVLGIRIPLKDRGELVMSRSSGSQRGNNRYTITVDPREKYGPIIFEGRSPGSRDPRVDDTGPLPDQRQQQISFFDNVGDDVNAYARALFVVNSGLSSSQVIESNQPILYQPEIYLEEAPEGNLWSSFVRNFSIVTSGERQDCHPGQQIDNITIVNPGNGYLSRPENYSEGDKVRSYVGCFTDIEILSTGVGYNPDDEITVTPNIPNLKVKVQMNELGQVVNMEVLDQVCGLESLPLIEINSPTGVGFKARTKLSFTPLEEYKKLAEENLGTIDPAQIVQVIDCVL